MDRSDTRVGGAKLQALDACAGLKHSSLATIAGTLIRALMIQTRTEEGTESTGVFCLNRSLLLMSMCKGTP
jgi:hypothetical protein